MLLAVGYTDILGIGLRAAAWRDSSEGRYATARLSCNHGCGAGDTRVSAGGVPAAAERRLLYIAVPGIRNYVQYGGVGVLVYDIDAGYKFVKRIPTWATPAGQDPENVKGVAASAVTGRLYVSTIRRLCCIDFATEKMVWDVTPDGGCDRQTISPDGKILYVPVVRGAALDRHRRDDRARPSRSSR